MKKWHWKRSSAVVLDECNNNTHTHINNNSNSYSIRNSSTSSSNKDDDEEEKEEAHNPFHNHNHNINHNNNCDSDKIFIESIYHWETLIREPGSASIGSFFAARESADDIGEYDAGFEEHSAATNNHHIIVLKIIKYLPVCIAINNSSLTSYAEVELTIASLLSNFKQLKLDNKQSVGSNTHNVVPILCLVFQEPIEQVSTELLRPLSLAFPELFHDLLKDGETGDVILGISRMNYSEIQPAHEDVESISRSREEEQLSWYLVPMFFCNTQPNGACNHLWMFDFFCRSLGIGVDQILLTKAGTQFPKCLLIDLLLEIRQAVHCCVMTKERLSTFEFYQQYEQSACHCLWSSFHWLCGPVLLQVFESEILNNAHFFRSTSSSVASCVVVDWHKIVQHHGDTTTFSDRSIPWEAAETDSVIGEQKFSEQSPFILSPSSQITIPLESCCHSWNIDESNCVCPLELCAVGYKYFMLPSQFAKLCGDLTIYRTPRSTWSQLLLERKQWLKEYVTCRLVYDDRMMKCSEISRRPQSSSLMMTCYRLVSGLRTVVLMSLTALSPAILFAMGLISIIETLNHYQVEGPTWVPAQLQIMLLAGIVLLLLFFWISVLCATTLSENCLRMATLMGVSLLFVICSALLIQLSNNNCWNLLFAVVVLLLLASRSAMASLHMSRCLGSFFSVVLFSVTYCVLMPWYTLIYWFQWYATGSLHSINWLAYSLTLVLNGITICALIGAYYQQYPVLDICIRVCLIETMIFLVTSYAYICFNVLQEIINPPIKGQSGSCISQRNVRITENDLSIGADSGVSSETESKTDSDIPWFAYKPPHSPTYIADK